MRQRPSLKTTTPSDSNPALHSVLQMALSSLDVQLDDELARYRRHRGRRPGRVTSGQGRVRNPKSLEAASTRPEQNRPKSDAASPIALTAAAGAAFAPESYSVSSSQPSGGRSSQLAVTTERYSIPDMPSSELTHSAAPTAERQVLANPEDVELGPDDYLESSEELLRSLTEETDLEEDEKEPSVMESLLTPLGIGSMLLLLLSSLTLGYLITNPAGLGLFSDDDLGSQTSAPTKMATEEAAGNSSVDHGRSIPDSPNLANQEFTDLNLRTLSTIPTQTATGSALPAPTTPPIASTPTEALPTAPTAAPTVIPESATPATASVRLPSRSPDATNSAPVTPARPRSPRVAQPPAPSRPRPSVAAVRPSQPAVAPAPVAPAPTPASTPVAAPSPTAPSPTRSASAQDDYYYVITDYSGDRGLEQIRQSVGDAYVRNTPEGAQVQLGAFSDRNRAEELVQELQQQGISTEIYQPED